MILVMGGTTEGKQVAALLNKVGQGFLYSTKTKTSGVTPQKGRCLHGALDEAQMKSLCIQEQIDLIIDAAHPFAVNLHQTVSSCTQALDLPLVRYERIQQKRIGHPLVHYVKNYEEALLLLQKLDSPSLLALSGVQSIPELNSYWKNTQTYFRILDRAESKDIAEANHFPTTNLILGYPSENLKQEIALYQTLNIGIVLTKESGPSGKLMMKIEAATQMDIPIIIIKKPVLPHYDFTVSDTVQLNKVLTQMIAL